MLIDITNFNFECGDKGGYVLINFNFACENKNNGGTETYNLELELTDYGYGYGKFKLNNTTYSPTTTPYKLNFTDELTSFSLMNSNVTRIISFPNTSKVKSLNSVFAYAPITNLNVKDWDLSGVEEINFAFSYLQKCKSIKFNTDILKGKTSAQGLFGVCDVLETVNSDMPSDGIILGESTSGITNASYMFFNCYKIQSVTFDPSRITNAKFMFDGCTSLTSIKGGKWNGVTDASYMFSRCSSLDMNYFDTNNVFWQDLIRSNCTSMEAMFSNCDFKEKNVNFPPYWDVSSVINMQHLFESSNLGDFTIPNNWLWSSCISFYKAFANNPMQTINLQYGHWDNAKNFSYMFDGCSNLTSVDFSYGYNLTGVTNVEGMFNGCNNLQVVYVSDCDAYDIIKRGLESSGLDSSIIQGCDCDGSGGSGGYSVLSFIMNDYTSSEYYINGYSQYFSSSNENELYSASTEDMKNMVGGDITSLVFVGEIKQFVSIPFISTLKELKFENLDVDFIDLSKTNLNTLTNFVFYDCSNLKHIDLSNWTSFNLSNYDFFTYCSNLKSIKMLNCCEEAKEFIRNKLSESEINAVVITEDSNTYLSLDYTETPIWYYIDGNSYDTGNYVTDLSSNMYDGCSVYDMFRYNGYLKTVYTMPSLSGTTSHYSMFNGCGGLLYQDLSTWDFDFNNGDQDINSFFNGSSSLVWVNFSGWDLTNAENYESMFYGCEKLKYVFAYGCNDDTISKLDQAISHSGYSINLVY